MWAESWETGWHCCYWCAIMRKLVYSGLDPEAWGPLRSSMAWNSIFILRLKDLWDPPSFLLGPSEWEWHRLGGLKLLQDQPPLLAWARARSQHSWLRNGLEVAQIAFHSQTQTSGMCTRISDRGANFPGPWPTSSPLQTWRLINALSVLAAKREINPFLKLSSENLLDLIPMDIFWLVPQLLLAFLICGN